jgi:putative ABC transport system permease protein
MLLLSLAVRNARRNVRRSLLTALMITLGVALLTVAMAWIDGVLGSALDGAARNIGMVRVVTPEFAAREQVLPIDENFAESRALEAAIAAVPGVTSVVPRIQMPVTVSAGDAIGERFGLLSGAPASYYAEVLDLDAQLVGGRLPQADGEVVIGQTLAEQVGASLGAEVVILGATQDGSLSPAKVTIVGVADLGNASQDRQIFGTLEQVRYLADIPDGATELLVFGPSRDDAPDTAAAVAALPETKGLDVRAWSQRKPFDELLGFIGAVHTVSGGVIVFITALGVFNTMLMSVLERTGEVGVLRALGLKAREVVVLFVVEALTIALVGGAAGAVLGSVGALYLQEVGVNLGSAVDKVGTALPVSSVVYARLTPDTLVGAVLLGLVMAVLGGALPAFRAARISPVEAMRSRR